MDLEGYDIGIILFTERQFVATFATIINFVYDSSVRIYLVS